MTPEPFVMNDPWWIVLIKAVGIVLLVLTWQIVNVWFERRVLGKMQQRKGPIMNGPFGLGQTLGDGLKFLLKEDFAPGMVDKVLYSLAPLIAGVSAFTAWSVIPMGGQVSWPPPPPPCTASCSPATPRNRRTPCWAPCAPAPR